MLIPTSAGATLAEVPHSDDPATFEFTGSTLVCTAESRDEIMRSLADDVYAKSGVWDLEKVQIWPVSLARAALPTLTERAASR